MAFSPILKGFTQRVKVRVMRKKELYGSFCKYSCINSEIMKKFTAEDTEHHRVFFFQTEEQKNRLSCAE